MLFNPFEPPAPPATGMAEQDTQIDLGPLPFDTYAPPAPTHDPHLTPEPALTMPAKPSTTRRPTTRPTTRKSTKHPDGRPTPRDPTSQQRLEPTRSPHNEPRTPPSNSTTTSAPSTPRPSLQRPPAPRADLPSTTLSLGSGRSGSISVNISPGTGTWSATGTDRINVDADGSFTINAPRAEPGCPGSARTESGTITITWRGTNAGDGITTKGTSTASGTLPLTVSWDIAKDKGTWVVSPSTTGGGYWSNCSPH
ncbi:hypothetical protein [Nonomuraea ceibae]|uniref:hypothetical protein n=1 Tax=Nonomuraea ceibae TaxID=1935170 RepID=UPI001C601E8E|nr:hypothetical protein [Nonomuraea ceibae]